MIGTFPERLNEYDVNGFAVIENFLTDNETDEIREAGIQLQESAPKVNQIAYQNHSISSLEQYIFDSATKIKYFYDNDVFDQNGNLLLNKSMSLNRLGHGLHQVHPTFKKYTFDDRVKDVVERIGFRKPAIMQSVFVYKNTKCKQHQDLSHLLTNPVKVATFWISTEDATSKNGCLWFVRGSHKNGLFNRYISSLDPSSNDVSTNENKWNFFELNIPRDQFTVCPVKRGSLVILDGNTIHFSDQNFIREDRFTYTFRIMETDYVNFSPEKWFRPSDSKKISWLY